MRTACNFARNLLDLILLVAYSVGGWSFLLPERVGRSVMLYCRARVMLNMLKYLLMMLWSRVPLFFSPAFVIFFSLFLMRHGIGKFYQHD